MANTRGTDELPADVLFAREPGDASPEADLAPE
ncbi:MAG: hypothetical protein JWM80_2491, partial [Cyanobacteria bacterium RYN_339]|nr:hypothetical protein [Cyanobacteria bacterium RYN_339]